MLDTIKSEYAVIGSILIDPDCLSYVTAILNPDDFAYEINKSIFRATVQLANDGKTVDPVTVLDALKTSGEDVESRYIMELMAVTPTAVNVEEYAKIVKADSRRRALRALTATVEEQLDSGMTPEEVTGNIYTTLEGMEKAAPTGIVKGNEAIAEFYEYRKRLEAGGGNAIVRTGYQDLDRMLGGGLVSGGLYVIAARPGVGKTTTGICITENIAKAGMPVLFVSLEMTRLELTAKRLARESGVKYNTVLMGMMNAGEYKSVNEASARLYGLPVTMTDKPRMTVTDIALTARRVKGLRCLVVDYFGLITPDTKRNQRYEQYTEIIDDLKRLAKTLNIPIICLAQLNRENEQRSDKRPRLADLRETGAVEQSADAVIFLHRERYYATDAEPLSDSQSEDLDVIIAKNRHGSVGTLHMMWFGATGRIYSKHEN